MNDRPWFLVYKCQLCEEEYVNEDEPIEATVELEVSMPGYPSRRHPQRKALTAEQRAMRHLAAAWAGSTTSEPHHCREGRVGVAFVIGVVREQSDLERIAEVANE